MSQSTSKTSSKDASSKDAPTGKYGALIRQAKSGDNGSGATALEIEAEDQNAGLPENQKNGLSEAKAEEVNLSIKVPKRLRRHWVSEAKRRDTTLTAAIITALKEKFGEPEDEG
jgi:hypothetical protein